VDLYHLADLSRTQSASGRAYLEFQRSPDLSTGLYVLPAGGTDLQSPHTEDEIYYVIEGTARMRVDSDERSVATGDVIFVPAGAPHRFVDITAELRLVVVFGPAEGDQARAGTP